VPQIRLITTARNYEIDVRSGEYVFEVLGRCGIPANSVLLLDELDRFCSLTTRLGDNDVVNAYALRNVDYGALFPRFTVEETVDSVTELLLDGRNGVGKRVIQLSRDKALDSVYAAVRTVLNDYLQPTDGRITLQIGLSPGGDGRILAECIARYIQDERRADFHCIIVGAGFEDEEEHVSNAVALADRFNLSYTTFSSSEAGRLLGYSIGLDELAQQYRVEHPDDAAEMLPTYLLQELHFAVGRAASRRGIIMGYNFEDTLAERLYHLMSGVPLPPFPVRRLPDFDIIAPLCKIDKYLLDSLDIGNSIRNYSARRASGGDVRSSLYVMAYSIAQMYPSLARNIAHGASWSGQPSELDEWLHSRSR